MISSKVFQALHAALGQFDTVTAAELKSTSHYAATLHSKQAPRPSGEAYENHVIRVAARIVNDFGIIDKELFVAALFHDAVEDQLDTLVGKKVSTRQEAYVTLSKKYSPRVSAIVQSLTNTEEYKLTNSHKKRNNLYVSHVIQECEQSNDCFVVKLSDFFDNAMQLQQNNTPESRLKGATKYLPLFDYFASTLASERTLPLTSEIRRNLFEKIQKQKEYIVELISLSSTHTAH